MSTKILKTKEREYSTARIGLKVKTKTKRQFRTRKRGSPRQIGQVFPISRTKMPARPKITGIRGVSPLALPTGEGHKIDTETAKKAVKSIGLGLKGFAKGLTEEKTEPTEEQKARVKTAIQRKLEKPTAEKIGHGIGAAIRGVPGGIEKALIKSAAAYGRVKALPEKMKLAVEEQMPGDPLEFERWYAEEFGVDPKLRRRIAEKVLGVPEKEQIKERPRRRYHRDLRGIIAEELERRDIAEMLREEIDRRIKAKLNRGRRQSQ